MIRKKSVELLLLFLLPILFLLVGCSNKRIVIRAGDDPGVLPFPEWEAGFSSEPVKTGFKGILGCSGYFEEYAVAGEQTFRDYYTDSGTLLASTFGFHEMGEDIVLDIDGDGVTELISNMVYGDGARRLTVFRLRNGCIEQGTLDEEPYWDDSIIYRSIEVYYDLESRRIVLRYRLADDVENRVTVDWDSFDCLVFTKQNDVK